MRRAIDIILTLAMCLTLMKASQEISKQRSAGGDDGMCANQIEDDDDTPTELKDKKDYHIKKLGDNSRAVTTLRKINRKAFYKVIEIAKQLKSGDTLTFVIDSEGGSVVSAEYIIKTARIMREEGIEITCNVKMAMSAAFMIAAQACGKVNLAIDAELMWHAPYRVYCGSGTITLDDARKTVVELESIKESMLANIDHIFRSNKTLADESFAASTVWSAPAFIKNFNPPKTWTLEGTAH